MLPLRETGKGPNHTESDLQATTGACHRLALIGTSLLMSQSKNPRANEIRQSGSKISPEVLVTWLGEVGEDWKQVPGLDPGS